MPGPRWPAEAIWEAVSAVLPDFSVEIVPEIDSTSSELMRRARAGRTEPVLLLAEHQTAGRGRLGRHWQTAPGAALTFSFGLPLAPEEWSGLSLVVGVAAAEALHPEVGLKWPNDLWWQDRKLAGILVETAGTAQGRERFVVVGLGLNIATPQPTDQALRAPPAGLRELEPGIDAAAALGRIAAPLLLAVQAFGAQGFAPWRERFAARDVLRDRAVRLSDGRQGVARGVDAQGALLVDTGQGPQALHSAEISVRPAGLA